MSFKNVVKFKMRTTVTAFTKKLRIYCIRGMLADILFGVPSLLTSLYDLED